jgi:SOS response regulatory protein OraA/RecX
VAREPDPRKRRGKLSRYLQRRGFAFDTIRRVIDEVEARHDANDA